jgi:NAD(P)-dependent dehydrogenase (short-subunit alcohol dehydrogenase family)
MQLRNSIAVVTGANRGLGRHFAAQLLERGASKVYAAARNPDSVDLPGATPLRLDVTDAESIAHAAAVATDATLLINNAGIWTHAHLIDGDVDQIRLEMETHYFGALGMTRAFAPILTANGGGAILNVLSVLSWLHVPDYGAYSAAKTAAWAMTNVIRQELAPKGIHVAALHVGYMDTDMASHVAPEDKIDPARVAAAALGGIEAGVTEILADDMTRSVKRGLAAAPAVPISAVLRMR